MSDPLATHRFAFYGNIETTVDALRIVHAASLGIVPRVQHRLDRLEQKSHIVSGATFVYQTHESDGLSWSPSHVDGNFLVYNQVDRPDKRAPDLEPSVPLTGGLRKRTLSVELEEILYHLVTYSTRNDLNLDRLKRPSSFPELMALRPPPELFRLDKMKAPPLVVTGSDGLQQFFEREENQPVYLTPPSEANVPTQDLSTSSATPAPFPTLTGVDNDQFWMNGQYEAFFSNVPTV
ncbi:Gti1/Pac2 family-domain-containing protein [Mycena rebaudengoi]|nr:Gti1/Pac2 family-domain-containing protein [Mycena rebaudengoi]